MTPNKGHRNRHIGSLFRVDVPVPDDYNGNPIPSEEAQQIFVPFFTTKPTGSGIGLSISRQIMKQSGGSLELIKSDTTSTLFRLKF
ncbi:MAG: ATP-binding protein [Prevotella sp.]|nr:ATP-binding protein [Prevotella sp.]MDY3251553.1 ATP-binding protein [Prevotella sp.]